MTDLDALGSRTALYHTFGCKLNYAETSTVAAMLAEKGIRRANPGETPDFVIVNTCSVTEVADKKCRQTIRAFHKSYPGAAIILTGCYAQLKAAEAASLPGVVYVAGINQKLDIARFAAEYTPGTVVTAQIPPTESLREFMPSCSRGDRTRFFLKVQDGCDYRCSYCTIPMARGRSRSGTIDSLVAQARHAAEQGGKEIVITGVNIGDFGKGRSDNFLDLCRALDSVDGIERYRISSIEPNLLTDEIIEFVASSRAFMPHFHVPLQCGSDTVLRLMGRRYDTALFRHKMELIRSTIPDAFIGVDLITGTRGETEELFRQSYDFADSLDISHLHVFPYSERPGTRALNIEGTVPQEEKHRRTQQMMELSARKHRDFALRFAGTVRPVLLEHGHGDSDIMGGFTDNYLKIRTTAAPGLDNTLVNARLDTLGEDGETFTATIC